MADLKEFVALVRSEASPEGENLLAAVTRCAIARLHSESELQRTEEGKQKAERVNRIVPYAALTCVHAAIERHRRRRRQPPAGASATTSLTANLRTVEAVRLFAQVEEALASYSY